MPRLVRRSTTSWRSAVMDALIQLSESLNLVDWDGLSRHWALPGGLFLNSVYWFAFQQGSLKNSGNDVIFESNHQSSPTKSSRRVGHLWRQAMWSISMICLGGSLFNAWYCFTRTRVYQINTPRTTAGMAGLTSGSSQRKAQSSSTSLARRLTSIFLSSAMAPPETAHEATDTSVKDITTITAWDPQLPCMRLFAVFSPLHAILPYATTQSLSTICLIILLTGQLLYLVELYTTHLDDRKQIYGQVFNEYEKSFVEPRLSIMKRDVGVGTRPDDNGVYVEVHTPKVGIIDAKTMKPGMPQTANQIKMHDWERPFFGNVGAGTSVSALGSPNVWAQQSPLKPVTTGYSTRHTIASPLKINGSPAKMYKPAGWGSQHSSSSNPFVASQQTVDDPPLSSKKSTRRSRTTSSLSHWD